MPDRLKSTDDRLADVLTLIRDSFAYMDERIDPPSSMHRLTLDGLREQAAVNEVWAVDDPPVACVIFTLKSDCLYVGKLAVAEAARKAGHARRLIELATMRARELDVDHLELESRVELTEVHAAFERLGFEKVGTTAHEGYDRPTSYTMRKRV